MEIIPQLIINSLIAASIYALVSGGLALTYGLLRVINFAHGPMMMVGAYLYLFGIETFGGSVWVAALTTLLAVTVLSVVQLRLFIAPFLELNPLLTFVSTLALATICESVVSMTFGVNVRSLSMGGGVSSIELFSGRASAFITEIQIVIILSATVLIAGLAALLSATSVGRALRALSQHGAAAQSIGISRGALTLGLVIGGNLLAAFAGVLVGYETNLQPTMGNSFTIKALAAMVLGGLGSPWGALLGSVVLGFVENFGIGLDIGGWYLPAGYKDAFAYVIILVMVLIRPEGLLGKRGRLV